MHYACMIVGPDPETQLEPFADYLEVPRYKRFLDDEDRINMAEHYSLPPTDLAALAARLPDWEEADGGVEDGRLFVWSTANPNSKYDWFALGGRFDGTYLHLKVPVEPGFLRRLFGLRPRTRANQARKADVVEAHLLSDPPAALLRDGVWSECPITSDTAELQRWNTRFSKLFAAIPNDELLTIMDLHS